MTQPPPPTPEELILAMLRDVLARQAQQMGLPQPPAAAPPTPKVPAAAPLATPPAASPAPKVAALPASVPPAAETPLAAAPLAAAPAPQIEAPPPSVPPAERPYRPAGGGRPALAPDEAGLTPLTPAEAAELAEYEALAAQPISGAGLRRVLPGLALILLVIAALANLPLVNGRALLRPPAGQAPQALYEGLLLKGSGDAIYVIDGGRRRLISSADAFQHYGYRWEAVTEVADAYLRQIPEGQPLHVLLRCAASADLYLLQGGEKRWVSDPAALAAAGYSLETDVRTIPCSRLRAISDGLPFP
ncbi:MAG: hypothetical protein JNK29_12615 [Anaerolineales bacterium]|nr:hypothetical protein [Anaerolineales bacterium]